MDTVTRAPALPPGIDRAAYLAAGGIPPGALVVQQRSGAPAVLVSPDAEAPRTAVPNLWPVNLSAVFDPRVASLGTARHPVLQLTEQAQGAGLGHEVQLAVMHAMRRYYPTLDAAIKLRRVLEGDVYPVSDDEGLQTALREMWEGVPVGYVDGPGALRGGNAYLDALAENADEYGLAAGEIVTDEAGRAVERLVVPNARTLSIQPVQGSEGRRGGRRYELVQTDSRGQVPLAGALVQTLAFRTASETAWPEPLAWSLVQTTEAVLRMYQSVNQAWWRFGDPSMLLGLEYDKEASPDTMQVGTVTVPKELMLFKNTVEEVMNARRTGRVGDAYVATVGATVKNEVLGDVSATLMNYFEAQASTFDSYLVPLSDVPVWLFPTVKRGGDGLGGALSQNQAAIATTGAKKRNWKKRRLGQGVLDTMLVAAGDARRVGKYSMEATEVSVLDARNRPRAQRAPLRPPPLRAPRGRRPLSACSVASGTVLRARATRSLCVQHRKAKRFALRGPYEGRAAAAAAAVADSTYSTKSNSGERTCTSASAPLCSSPSCATLLSCSALCRFSAAASCSCAFCN